MMWNCMAKFGKKYGRDNSMRNYVILAIAFLVMWFVLFGFFYAVIILLAYLFGLRNGKIA